MCRGRYSAVSAWPASWHPYATIILSLLAERPSSIADKRGGSAAARVVRLTGLEPATSTSGAWRSLRAELQAR